MDNVPPPIPPPSSPPRVPPGTPYTGQPYTGTPYPGQPFTGQPHPRSWWSRNWLWFVPTGCLSVLALVALFVGGIGYLVFGVMKSSDVYKTAVARATANPEVVTALGTPINEGFVLSGKINTAGDTGNADLAIPISGPKDKGTISVHADRLGGNWNYSKMSVHVDGSGQDIDLNQEAP